MGPTEPQFQYHLEWRPPKKGEFFLDSFGPNAERLLNQPLTSQAANQAITQLLDQPPFSHRETVTEWRFGEEAPDKPESEGDAKAFMELLEARKVHFVVGPFRGQDSEALAKYAASTTYVVNPVSRDMAVAGLPQLIAAAPPRYTESEALGRLAARDAKARPQSRTVIFDLGDKNSVLQRRAFYQGFAAHGGDTAQIQSWDGRPTANLAERVGRDDLIATRFVLLDDKVLSAARILQGLRQRPASQTELWTVSTTVNSPSLDAFLLLRQPIVWVQTDRLEFATFETVDAHLSQALGESRSRWAWLGYDTALMLLANEPGAFTGPRRRYAWRVEAEGGQTNTAVELYRYDPKLGVNPIKLPALP